MLVYPAGFDVKILMVAMGCGLTLFAEDKVEVMAAIRCFFLVTSTTTWVMGLYPLHVYSGCAVAVCGQIGLGYF